MASISPRTILPAGAPAAAPRRVRRPGGAAGAAGGAWRVVRWLAATWLSLTLALVAVSVAPRLLDWTPSVVVSGSMRPALEPGHVVLVDTGGQPLVAGDIIVVPDPSDGSWISHRIVEIRDDLSIVTKGDANQSADTFRTDIGEVIGKVVLVVPFAGRPALLWQRGAAVDYAYWVLLVCASLVLAIPRSRRS